jgi:N-methylhydantoinase A
LPSAEPPPATSRRTAPAPVASRAVYEPGQGDMVETPIYLRADLAPGCRFDGPCVIAEDDTSTVVPDGFAVEVDGLGSLNLLNQAVDR